MVVTRLTRNQLYFPVPGVRIPPSPPDDPQEVIPLGDYLKNNVIE